MKQSFNFAINTKKLKLIGINEIKVVVTIILSNKKINAFFPDTYLFCISNLNDYYSSVKSSTYMSRKVNLYENQLKSIKNKIKFSLRITY